MGQFATGVAVAATSDSEGRPYGLTVNAFTSVSLQPLLVLICLENTGMVEVFKQAKKFGLSILAEDQEAISAHYSTKRSDRARYLGRVGRTGVPLLNECLATLECEAVQFYPGGDHTIMLAQVKSMQMEGAARGRKPLIFFQGSYRRLDQG
ncbi:MAG: flavin reductase family protein [Acidobacteria bacterium]|nr:flavin reductase family protein [Acidobacteriota bacterium]